MEDFDQYLNGEMNNGERRRFEQALSADPALQAELRVREGLRQLRLEQKVRQVATDRKGWEHKRNWRRLLLGCALAGLVGLAVFVWVRKEPIPPTPPSSQWPTQETPAVEPSQPTEKEEVAPTLPEKKEGKPGSQPIAETQLPDDLPLPAYPSPNVRGEEGSEDKAWKALLDQVWYADYPPAGIVPSEAFAQADQLLKSRDFNKAYVRLQRLERNLPASDTLRLLKAYCLMQMGEGAEALGYFEKLEEQQPNWQPHLQWYRGLSLLLTGERAKALAEFKRIAAAPKHPYNKQGERAVGVLE